MNIQDFPNYKIDKYDIINIKTGKTLKPYMTKRGYYGITLYKNNKRSYLKYHRLIAIYNIPNPYNLPFVDHINRDKTDNRIENLRWVDKSRNEENKDCRKNTKLNEKNISPHGNGKGYQIQARRNGKTIRKYVNGTLEEAIKIRNQLVKDY